MSPRKRQVLDLICRGFTNWEIASRIGVAQATVTTYRSQLMDQLSARNVAQLYQAATGLGLIPEGTTGTKGRGPGRRSVGTVTAAATAGLSNGTVGRSRWSSSRELRRIKDLSPRQRQVVTMACDGLTNREIGEQLGISVRTVEVHRYNLMRRLRVRNIAQLYQAALRLGLKRRLRPRSAFGERRRASA